MQGNPLLKGGIAMIQSSIISFHSKITEEPAFLRKPLTSKEWQEVREVLADHIERLAPTDKKILVESALSVAKLLKELDDFMNFLCLHTCPRCTDICCHAKDVFYNEVDLFFFTIYGDFYPPSQTRSSLSQKFCSYWEPFHGCRLERLFRPYVCTWFICEDQVRIMETLLPPRKRRKIDAIYAGIRHHRLILASFLPPIRLTFKKYLTN
jgi:hypothetical protein